MGSAASKGARTAGASVRKYPSRPSNTVTQSSASSPAPSKPSAPGPSVHPPPQASATRTEAINNDARDPVLASRLNTLGAVQPNPHFSPSSQSAFDPQRYISSPGSNSSINDAQYAAIAQMRNNPALRVLEARQRIQDEAEAEIIGAGSRGFPGRKYVDIGVIQLAMMRAQRGEPAQRIEDAFGIKEGRLSVLGKGIVSSLN